MSRLVFPKNFVWGVATSSYQIEGATRADGRGESIWDRFAHTPGKVKDGSSGDVACDHYHRWREDVALMKELGVQGYRFSIAWPRILPQGRGRVNQAGLDFYCRLVDELLRNDIEPFVTLYHWDLPQPLEDQGGWPERAAAEAFVEYTDLVTRALGDRVKHWITQNEPWCAGILGYQQGVHAPGRRDWPAALAASHHLLLSHGWAVPVIRRNSPEADVGIALLLSPGYPASPSTHDAEACRRFDGHFNRWFLDPLYGRGYPADVVADYTAAGYLPEAGMPWIEPGDLAAIAAPTDFLGVNYYTRTITRSDAVAEHENRPRTVRQAPPDELTAMGWEVFPAGLYDLLMRLHTSYRPQKLYVTENGASYRESPGLGDGVHDEHRVAYLREHIAAAAYALAAGVPLAGYFVWSLLDNFEWGEGYTQRFGLVWVDYETQQRVAKDSAHWYRHIITANAVDLA